MQTISSTLHPHDPQWREKRQRMIHKDLLPMKNERHINEAFLTTAAKPLTVEERAEAQELTRNILGGMFNQPGLMDALLRKSILDSTGTTTGGGVLVRQDLEPFLTALYVQAFPAW